MTDLDLTAVSHMGGAYVSVIDRARGEIGRHLDSADTRDAPTALRKAATAWRNTARSLDQIPTILAQLPAQVGAIAGDPDLTPEAKATRMDVATAQVQTEVDAVAAEVRDKLARIVDTIRRDAVPGRPGDTAADEARLANAKADLQMVLGALPGNDPAKLSARIGDLLTRALRDGDQHTAWLLGATHWPADYVAARNSVAGVDVEGVVAAHVGEALDNADGGAFAPVRRAYRSVNGANGANAVNVALAQLPGLVNDLREWTVRRTPQQTRPRAVSRW